MQALFRRAIAAIECQTGDSMHLNNAILAVAALIERDFSKPDEFDVVSGFPPGPVFSGFCFGFTADV